MTDEATWYKGMKGIYQHCKSQHLKIMIRKILNKIKEDYKEFITQQEKVAELSRERDFYKQSAERWIEKYGHLLSSNLELFNYQNFVAKQSDNSTPER